MVKMMTAGSAAMAEISTDLPTDLSTLAGTLSSVFPEPGDVSTLAYQDESYSERDRLLMDIERALKIYYSMFLITAGTIFNVLSIVVLSRSAFQHSTTSIYLRFLAAADMFTLYNGLCRHFVSGVSDFNIRHLNEAMCKYNQWSSAFAPDISAWILVAVTTERVLAIVWPHKVKNICSKATAWCVVISIALLLMASNLPLLLFHGNKDIFNSKTNVTEVKKCVILKGSYSYFMDNIWYWLDLTKFVLLPSLLLVVLNIIIITFVIRSRRRVERTSLISSQCLPSGKDNSFISVSSISGNFSSLGPRNQQHTTIRVKNKVTGSKKEVSLTVTLLTINVTFIVCNSPISVYLLGASSWFPPGYGPEEALTLTAAVMAMYTNNAANFLLYCATGSRFRSEIRQLFGMSGTSLKNCCHFGKPRASAMNQCATLQNIGSSVSDASVSIRP